MSVVCDLSSIIVPEVPAAITVVPSARGNISKFLALESKAPGALSVSQLGSIGLPTTKSQPFGVGFEGSVEVFELFVMVHCLVASAVVSVLIWDDLKCFSKFVNRRRATCMKGIMNKSRLTVNKIRGSG